MLLNRDADMKAADNRGRTALHMAARIGDQDTVELFQREGLILNVPLLDLTSLPLASLANLADQDGNTAVHYAARYGNPGVLNVLFRNMHAEVMRYCHLS